MKGKHSFSGPKWCLETTIQNGLPNTENPLARLHRGSHIKCYTQIFSVCVCVCVCVCVLSREERRMPVEGRNHCGSYTMVSQHVTICATKSQPPNGSHTNSAECSRPPRIPTQNTHSQSSLLSLAMCSNLEVLITQLFTIFMQKKQAEDNEPEL